MSYRQIYHHKMLVEISHIAQYKKKIAKKISANTQAKAASNSEHEKTFLCNKQCLDLSQRVRNTTQVWQLGACDELEHHLNVRFDIKAACGNL